MSLLIAVSIVHLHISSLFAFTFVLAFQEPSVLVPSTLPTSDRFSDVRAPNKPASTRTIGPEIVVAEAEPHSYSGTLRACVL